MNNKTLPLNKTRQHHQRVTEIVQPFLDCYSIAYYSYLCFFHENNTCVVLTTDPAFVAEYWHRDLYLRRQDLEDIPEVRLLHNQGNARDRDACKVSGLNHILLYTFKMDGLTIINAFGTYSPFNTMSEFYLNNLDLIRLFCEYFKQEAYEIIEDCRKTPYLLENFDDSPLNDEAIHLDTVALKQSLQQRAMKAQPNLSAREQLCFDLLEQGKSVMVIAKEIETSVSKTKTIIRNINMKVNRIKMLSMLANSTTKW